MEDRWALKSEVGGGGAYRPGMGGGHQDDRDGDRHLIFLYSLIRSDAFCFWLRGKFVVRGIFGVYWCSVRTTVDGEDSMFHLWKSVFKKNYSSSLHDDNSES
ncbi:hypothetical protein OIU79_025951 [Salix purpurea]|uniref:Uncharacterized protein n=1 Tax=Salix purpurea TaxID=77065 RepID=A0A9Q0W629_SALPP|nr:hypothetical protein OIU79_025951 [Salix purpurea]